MTENELKKLSIRKREIERDIKKLLEDVAKIDRTIPGIDNEISQVVSELNLTAVELRIPGLSTDVKAQLRTREQQLRTEKELQLRKESQLRTEKELLLTKEERLQREREQLQTQEAKLRAALGQTVSSSYVYLDRALLMDPPSKTNMKREQLDPVAGPLIQNWRPTQDKSSGLLPELAHPTFGEVVELLDSDTEVDQAVIDVASQLCCIGADLYQNEAQLTKRVRGLLLPFLEDKVVTTVESGFAGNNVSPDWALGDSPKNPTNLFLIAEVIGPHARLSAVAWLNRVTIFPLTPLLNLLPAHPVTDRLLMPVARMLAALRAGLRKLTQDHATAAVRTAAEHEVAQAGPAKAEDAKAEEAEAEEAAAETEDAETAEELADLLEAKPVSEEKLPWPIAMDARYRIATAYSLAAPNHTYRVGLAGDDSGREGVVAVKLCRSYSLAAHQRWADLGLAPKILRSMPLPGGWLLVEMEWLSAPQWRPLSKLSKEELDEAQCAVQQALERAHTATGMVHGDVRPPNCLMRRDEASWEVRFVDFEWAGPEGEATYPACLNPDIPWPEGVGYRKQLQREHDIKLLAATLAARGAAAASAASTGTTAGRGRRTRGRGAVRSLNTTSSSGRSAAPPGIAVVFARHRIAGISWRQHGAISWTRPAAPGRRLVW
ncbi:hypothetical protein HXX76_016118 [Chlamydomonas incerta]|uniref:Protein kinase domain-containing protein n=1 Tax=Chlamydomonas incerta TaxID=51695 RepID=A0A835S7S2_CHLIN|nr:hypothetical protein HXX76_016118 [Chlamydomonas incerta]|eukprot:KAG2422317.1 hypothetical protein HXX76_016118 [Chlamydomonas incerta]